MQTTLKNITTFKYGPHLRTQGEGEVKYLHSKHFDELSEPTLFANSFVESSARSEKFLLKKNDVIITGKGLRIFAWAYDEDFGKAVPSSLFFILRPNPNKVLGKYLALLLNSEKINYQIRQAGAGASILSIPKKELGEIKVDIPSLDKQHEVVYMVKTFNFDIMLTQELLQKKKLLRREVLNQILSNSKAE